MFLYHKVAPLQETMWDSNLMVQMKEVDLE